jgi:hypothetical protein
MADEYTVIPIPTTPETQGHAASERWGRVDNDGRGVPTDRERWPFVARVLLLLTLLFFLSRVLGDDGGTAVVAPWSHYVMLSTDNIEFLYEDTDVGRRSFVFAAQEYGAEDPAGEEGGMASSSPTEDAPAVEQGPSPHTIHFVCLDRGSRYRIEASLEGLVLKAVDEGAGRRASARPSLGLDVDVEMIVVAWPWTAGPGATEGEADEGDGRSDDKKAEGDGMDTSSCRLSSLHVPRPSLFQTPRGDGARHELSGSCDVDVLVSSAGPSSRSQDPVCHALLVRVAYLVDRDDPILAPHNGRGGGVGVHGMPPFDANVGNATLKVSARRVSTLPSSPSD